MRTRFLGIDYFNSATAETVEFLRLPPPYVPPPTPFALEDLCCSLFDDASALSLPLEIETLPIDIALSKFFSNVIPQFIDVETGDLADSPSCIGEARFDKQRKFSPRSSIEFQDPEEKNEHFFHGKEENGFEVVKFEIPELGLSLEDGCFLEEEKFQLFAEVGEADHNIDMLGPVLTLQHPFEILESICSVDDISPKYCTEQETFVSEGAGSAQDQVHLHNSSFPLLEVDEISLGIFSSISIEVEFILLENVEPQPCPQSREVLFDGKELFSSLGIDILEYLADHCLSHQGVEAVPSCSNSPLEMDLISIIELPHIGGNSAFQQAIPDDNANWSMCPVKFEEFQFLQFDYYQFLEVFSNSLTIFEAESEPMFVEDSNLGKINELIVSHELTLVDESFKSLPVPILSDPEEVMSRFLFVEDMLISLKPQPPSMSDDIYLEWHFLEEDYSNHDKYSSCWKQVLEINNCSIDSDLESLNDGIPIFDLVFSGDTPNGAKKEEEKEPLNVLSGGISTVCVSLDDFVSSKLLNDGCQKHGNGECLTDINAERVSTLAESTFPFNDLNFFLNPREATTGSFKPAVKAFDGNATFPAAPSTNQIAPCAMTAVQLQQWDLKMEVEASSIPKSLCEGVDMPQNLGFTSKLEVPLPCEEKYDMGSSRAGAELKALCMPLPIPFVPSVVEPEQIPINMPSFPDMVIIVNTQNFDKEMIISRRSTYQRILTLEKQGAQVVERDLKLPVDVIISAATCLVWYDCRNIGKKSTAPDEASSCLPLCIENIATNVLTSLSFAFSCCILVFEGESTFLATVMESSDGLYAAAASLGIDVQIFCSYSTELTDEIILSCIGSATKLTRHTYPKMPESETLAESFLTAFPSINPLSAHAILSLGVILVDFLEWSQERRIRATQKYHVPDESVSLLSALCRYGELEDSKSAMTDCSSSVSPAPDSENCHCKTDFGRKKGKYIGSPSKIDTAVDNLFHFELLKQFPDGNLNLPRVSKPHNTWTADVCVGDEWFSQKQDSGPSGVVVMMNPSKGCKQLDFQISRKTDISNEIKNPSLPLNNKLFGPEEPLDMAVMNKFDYHFNNNCENRWKDLIDEVSDVGDSFSVCEDFSTIGNSLDLSRFAPGTDKKPAVASFRTARNLSFSMSSLPVFPTAAEISSDSNFRVNNYGQTFREEINRNTDDDFNKHKLPSKHQENLLEGGSIQKTAPNYLRSSLKNKDKQQNGGTPFSKALHSAQSQQGSPWTIEFLNRVREKSRLRQESLPHDMSPLSFPCYGNKSKLTKRKSPSILDFYKYQGGRTPRKMIEQKRQKRSTPISTSKNEKTSTSFCPTWTPLDKRASRTLSFSKGGRGGQSKLVWSDKDIQTMDKIFYHRT